MLSPSIKVNPWFRLHSEFATDPKIQMLSEADQRRFVMLLCLRCSNGDVTLHDHEIAFQLRISDQEWEATKKCFIERKLIDKNNRVISWEKRQYLSDSSVERVRRHRERMKQGCNVTETLRNGSETVSVTPPDTDTDTDTDSERYRKQVSSPAKGQRVPMQEIVDLYNEVCVPFGRPVASVLNKKRQQAIKRVWQQSEHARTIDWWRDYFESAMKIEFMAKGFQRRDGGIWPGADFDYLLQEKTIVRVVEHSA